MQEKQHKREVIDSFTGKYQFLSNFYPSPMVYEGETYATVEHGFQALKALRIEHRDGIRRAATPGLAKQMGRRAQLRPDWEAVKNHVMLTFLRLKFATDPLRMQLMSTHDAELIEGNNHGDAIWGMVDGYGENRLGILLMKVREELLAQVFSDVEETRRVILRDRGYLPPVQY